MQGILGATSFWVEQEYLTIKFSKETRRTLLGVSAVFLALIISCRFEYCR